MRRADIAHFWFVTLHPFGDGNGRMARATWRGRRSNGILIPRSPLTLALRDFCIR
jgi:hypothetical protein